MRVLSIDPGYERVGIAILEKNDSKRETLIYSECFKTSPSQPHHQRLLLIGKKIKEIIEKYLPDFLATEKLFFNENQKTALHVAEARGVILYEGTQKKLELYEYTPLQIKIAVTGYGRANKNQVILMVRKLIDIHTNTKQDDEFDAIAIGLTHFASHKVKDIKTKR